MYHFCADKTGQAMKELTRQIIFDPYVQRQNEYCLGMEGKWPKPEDMQERFCVVRV